MAAQITQQYAYRAQKLLGLVGGAPDYAPIPEFIAPESPTRIYAYSPDGGLMAYALPSVVRVFEMQDTNWQLINELAVPNVIELAFSPRGTYFSIWERPLKLEDGQQHKNLRVYSTHPFQELVAFSQKSQDGWNFQYTSSESHAIRLVAQEIQVYDCAAWQEGIVYKLRVEGATSVSLSPGPNPSVAVFVAEKKGAPASIKIYNLGKFDEPPTCQKAFFKADRSQIKWNALGTHALLLTQTEVDNSNKSYYGETGLYMLSSSGDFDCRVTLDREGPVYDFAWSPNSKEFCVVYGYMPAKTMLFDQGVRVLNDFGSSPHNFISYNPQGRLMALAGFGSLAGKIDIICRRSLTKVCSIDAPNTTYCEWSPDGRYLLTAILSPRLRVDNGIKIWHCTGPLVHIQSTEELYQVSWRPIPVTECPPFGPSLPPAPEPSESVRNNVDALKHMTPSKAAGAYRPPGARGLATPAFFKREDEGGEPRMPTNGAATPPRVYNRTVPGAAVNSNGVGGGQNGIMNGGRRHVPGAANSSAQGLEGDKKNNRKRKGGKDGRKEGGSIGTGAEIVAAVEKVQAAVVQQMTNGRELIGLGMNGLHVPEEPSTPIPGEGSLDPIAKKIRNLNKKLKAIEELKDKAQRGERLEATQLKKMEGEADIRRDLANLSVAA